MSLIYGMSTTIWKGISLVVMTTGIIMISVTLNTDNWFKQKISIYGFDSWFYGGLLKY